MEGKTPKRRRYQSNKSVKHLLERQRRARINHSLSELKNLVLSAIHQGNPHADLNGCEKMEKAEILELTVNYIKAIRSRGNLGVWKMECTSESKQCGSCFSCSVKGNAKLNRPQMKYRDTSFSNYGNHRENPPSSQVQASYGKPFCSCFSGTCYGLVTPPLSPSLGTVCINAQYGAARTPAESIRQLASPPTNATSSISKVWRPW